ncbi:tetratricopeptide repeat protein [Alteromonas facilis]|uniref:tetratricopeptide repeat protein n=1 Tax=Alteromonas facilis TaxID=2048004 RepID=UPI000C28EB28|nr:tetratricopeptide repeat protein [Alteromonas facilis]
MATIFRVTGYLVMPLLIILAAFGVYQLLPNPYGLKFWSLTILLVAITAGYLLWLGKSSNAIGRHKQAKTLFFFSFLLPFLAVILLWDYRVLVSPSSLQSLTGTEWQQDLDQLASNIKTLHPNAMALVDERTFDEQVKEIRSGIEAGWSDTKIKLAFMHLLAQINDGHSIIPPQPAIDFHILPIIMHKLSDSVVIVEAGRHLTDLKNSKVIAVNDVPIEDVFSKVEPYIGAESVGNKWDRFALYGAMAELLEEVSVKAVNEDVILTLEKDGVRSQQTVKAEPYYQWAMMYFSRSKETSDSPYVHNMFTTHFWTRYDEDSQAYYVNINELQDDNRFSVEDFANYLKRQFAEKSIEKVVIDLRQNRGGDNFKTRHLVEVIRNSNVVNQHGKLYVLISGRTYSAAANFVSLLERQTNAIFVGEPTGQGANHYGDSKGFTLRHSGIWGAISRVTWRGSFKEDTSDTVKPHIPVRYTYDDYVQQRDPALEIIHGDQQLGLVALTEIPTANRYLTDDGQLVWFDRTPEGQVQLRVDDFSRVSLNRLFVPLYEARGGMHPHLRNLSIETVDGELALDWAGKDIQLTKVGSDYKMPFSLFYSDDVSEIEDGVKLLKQAPEYAYLQAGGEIFYRVYGYGFYNNGEPAKAAAIFEYIRWFNEDNTYAWSRLGMAQFRSGDILSSIFSFNRALELNPNNTTASDMMYRLQQEMPQ